MQVKFKTFVVGLFQEISLVCSVKPIGEKFSSTANAFCFLPILWNYILH